MAAISSITQSLANTAGFIPQSWANEALSILRQNIAVCRTVATDADYNAGGFKGKSLTIPYPGKFSAQAKTAGNTATVQTPTGGSSVTVTLSTHNTVDFVLEDVPFSEATSGIAMMQSYGQAAGIALAEQLETDLLASLVGGSYGGLTGTAGTDLVKGPFFTARKTLNDNKAPGSDRSIVISTKDAASLMQDSTLQSYFAFNQNVANTLKEGTIGRFAGFDIYESQFVGSNASGHRVQTVTISGGVTGGTFTLTYGGQTTAAIAWNATASAVQAALNAISSLGANQVTVTGIGGNNGVYTVYFTSAVVTPTAITGSAGSLTGGVPALTIADAALNYQNVAYHKNALIVAFRRLEAPATPGVDIAYATDPMSGISLRVMMQYKPEYRGLYVAYDILYGYTNLRPDQAVVVLS